MSQKETSREEGFKEADFIRQLLDSYFQFRDSLPRGGYIQENKTTQQIQDELEPMYSVPTEDIVGYMLDHEYSPTMLVDGTVAWAVWRYAEVAFLT